MTINLTCPCCGHPVFRQTARIVVERLMEAKEPLTRHELLDGINVSDSAWQAIREGLAPKLKAQGYRLVNATKHRGGTGFVARYRLEKLP